MHQSNDFSIDPNSGYLPIPIINSTQIIIFVFCLFACLFFPKIKNLCTALYVTHFFLFNNFIDSGK